MSSFSVSFKAGFKDIAPVIVAYVPIGLLWGTLAAGTGFSALEAMLTSAMVYAGASQFVALTMWAEPAPALLLAVTAFVVNLRHGLMSASLTRHISGIPAAWRYPLMYVLTDESWAMAERRALSGPLDLGYMLGSSFFLWPTWFLCSFLGAAIGKNLGDPARLGLNFAFAAIFITIIMGFWKGRRTGVVIVASAAVAAGFKLFVPGAWHILAGGLAGVSTAAAIYREGEE